MKGVGKRGGGKVKVEVCDGGGGGGGGGGGQLSATAPFATCVAIYTRKTFNTGFPKNLLSVPL